MCGWTYPSSTICLSKISDGIEIDDVTCGTKSTTLRTYYMRPRQSRGQCQLRLLTELLVFWSRFLLNNEVILFNAGAAKPMRLVKHLLTGRVESCGNVLCSGGFLSKVYKYSVYLMKKYLTLKTIETPALTKALCPPWSTRLTVKANSLNKCPFQYRYRKIPSG